MYIHRINSGCFYEAAALPTASVDVESAIYYEHFFQILEAYLCKWFPYKY